MSAIQSVGDIARTIDTGINNAPGLGDTIGHDEVLHAACEKIPVDYRTATILPGLKTHLGNKNNRNLLIHGPPGTGKTHQCWAVARFLLVHQIRSLADMRIRSTHNGDRYVSEGRNNAISRLATTAWSYCKLQIISESGDIARHRFDHEWLGDMAATEDWLVIDDIGFSPKPSEWTVEAIYHLANERRAWQRKTIWTTNRTPNELRDMFGGAIASRLLGGAVIEMDGQDRRLA
jgi:chromosomal replication initiation ATPase DnaA